MEKEREKPNLVVHPIMTKKDYKCYLDQLDSALSEIDYVEKRKIKLIKAIPRDDEGKIKPSFYLVFLPVTYKGIPCDVILKRDDFYLVGVEVWGSCFIFSEDSDSSVHMEAVKGCLKSLEQHQV